MKAKDVPILIVAVAAAVVYFAAKPFPKSAPPAASAAARSPTPPPTLAERATLALAREKPACSCTMNEALAEAILASPE